MHSSLVATVARRATPRHSLLPAATAKGQLISKCFFGVADFLQETNENKSHSSKIEFIRSIFGGNVGLKK